MDRDMKTLVWQYYRHRKSLNVNDVIKKYGRDSLIINYSVKPKNNGHIDNKDSSVTDCCINDACMNDAYVNDAYVNDVYVNDVYVNDAYVNDVYVNDAYVNDAYVNDVYVNDAYVNDAYVNDCAEGTFGGGGCDYSTIDYSMNGCSDYSMNGCSDYSMNGIGIAEGTFSGGGSTIDYIDHGIMDELQIEIENIINNNYDPYTLSGPHFHCTMYDLIDHTRMI
jgi:hypothetical protein